MADYNFEIMQNTTRRFRLEAKKADGTTPYNFTNSTVRMRINFPSVLNKVMTVNGSGVGTSTTGISLGRPNPADLEGPLIDPEATSGHLTVRFAPAETAVVPPGTYQWECKVEGASDSYTLQKGTIKVNDSLFDPE